MQTLGLFDQLFYKADQYQVASLIMGGAFILAPARPGAPLDARAIADHLAARLQHIPLLRTRFLQDPLRIGSVRKVEDPDFNIWNHIYVTSVPKPGGYRQLSHHLAELSAAPLATDQLWRWTVLDGLRGGRLGVVCKIHHALADGLGAVAALSSLYDAVPVSPETPADDTTAAPDQPTAFALLGDALAESTRRLLVTTPRFLRNNTRPLLAALGGTISGVMAGNGAVTDMFELPDVGKTSLNISAASGSRTVAWKTLPLADIKALAKHFGCTVNDVGLLLYSFALQHYFAGIGETIDFDLWCGMPLSTRSADSDSGGNQVTIRRLSLHNSIDDAGERLRAIHQDAQELKRSVHPDQPEVDMQGLADLLFPTAIDGLMYLVARFNLLSKLGDQFLLANAVLSNVPGPRQPVYIANGVIEESIPLIPALDVMAVSGGITSQDKTLTIGFHCDGSVQQPQLMVAGVELGMRRLRAALRAGEVAQKKTRRKAAVKPRPRAKKPAGVAKLG